MYMCLQAWGLRVKVRSVCVCDWGAGGGGGEDNTGGEGRAGGESVPTQCKL